MDRSETAGPPSVPPRSFLRNERAGAPSARPVSLLRNETAAEEVLGVLLLLAIFSISVAVLYAGGLPSLWEAQRGASLQQVQQAFTSLDSKLSKAALGESPAQEVGVALAGGSLSLQNDSWMNVTIKDTSGNIVDCVNVSLGTLEYLKDDRYVAWEDGGIWARYPDGGQTMLSDPEFHYDGTTMTLPVIRLNGTGGASGAGTVRLTVNTTNVPILHYPYSTNTGPCAGLSSAQTRRANPLTGGNITITVGSNYYQAWANFFNESNVQSLVSATVDASAKTATATLSVQPADKDNAPFVLPIQITCINSSNCSNPVKTFKIDLAGRFAESCGIIKMDLRTPSINSGAGGSDGLHIYLERQGGNGPEPVTVTVDWKNGSTEEKWGPVTAATLQCSPPPADATVDLLNMTAGPSNYNDDQSATWGAACDLNPGDTTGWTDRPDATSYICYDTKGVNSCTVISDEKPPLGYVIAHYIALHISKFGALNFQCGASGDHCPGDANSISLESDYSLALSCGSAVTYLHISQDNLNATIG